MMLGHDVQAHVRDALRQCRRHLAAAAGFSALVNLLYIAPTLYMLQVYDRVVPTQGVQTLLFLTAVLLFALATLSLLDRVRSRLLVRAGVQLDTALSPLILDATLGRPDLPGARAALREFDTMRGTLTGPGILALFDAPWVPIYLLVCFLVHPWIGVVAVLGCVALPVIAWLNERATHHRLDIAQQVASQSYASQDALLGAADSIRALGMRRAMVARQLRQRRAMLIAQTEANFAAGGFLTAGKFVRLALQSLALGLGAWLAVDNQISGGAIFA
ncbi:ABC transporter transmembrane domain-containing protein, partial [Sphingomonas sanguinis]